MNSPRERHLLFLTGGLACFVCAAAWAQRMQEPSAAAADSPRPYSMTQIGQPHKVETLVGRGDKLEVIDKNGKATEITRKDLPILNRSREAGRASAPATAPEEAQKRPTEGTKPSRENTGATPAQEQSNEGASTIEPNKQAEAQPPGKRDNAAQTGKGAQANAKEAKVKAAEEEATKERAEAIRKANIEKLRKLEWDNAWFYDKSGKPISHEELDKRIEKGEVADIGATDIYLQNWKTEPEKPATGNQGEAASPGTNMQEK